MTRADPLHNLVHVSFFFLAYEYYHENLRLKIEFHFPHIALKLRWNFLHWIQSSKNMRIQDLTLSKILLVNLDVFLWHKTFFEHSRKKNILFSTIGNNYICLINKYFLLLISLDPTNVDIANFNKFQILFFLRNICILYIFYIYNLCENILQ